MKPCLALALQMKDHYGPGTTASHSTNSAVNPPACLHKAPFKRILCSQVISSFLCSGEQASSAHLRASPSCPSSSPSPTPGSSHSAVWTLDDAPWASVLFTLLLSWLSMTHFLHLQSHSMGLESSLYLPCCGQGQELDAECICR